MRQKKRVRKLQQLRRRPILQRFFLLFVFPTVVVRRRQTPFVVRPRGPIVDSVKYFTNIFEQNHKKLLRKPRRVEMGCRILFR